MLVFFDKIKRASSVWNLILCVTNKYCKNKHCGQDRDTLFKDRYDMQDRKWFLLTRLFSLRIFQDTKTKKCCFSNKTTCLSKHSFKAQVHSHWTFTYWDRYCFYWLIYFNWWNIRKSCFWSKIILLSRHSLEM